MSRAPLPGPSAPATPRLDDRKTDQAMQDHARRIDALAKSTAAGMKVIADVSLADGVATPISHGLGRPPLWVRESCVRGASSTGRVDRVTVTTLDPSTFVVLRATGFGATVTADVLVL